MTNPLASPIISRLAHPTPEQVRQARKAAQLKQAEAAHWCQPQHGLSHPDNHWNQEIKKVEGPIGLEGRTMTIEATQVRLAEGGSSIYVLSWGQYEDKETSGPFLGVAGLDFVTLAEEYQRDRYAAADAAGQDDCWLNERDFTSWMLDKGTLTRIESQDVYLDSFSGSFVPTHWPECPECGKGRGQPEYGNVRRSLNRMTAYRCCTECRHTWGHTEVANNESMPMLEDDGRETPSGCVPFAISKACGLPFSEVLPACERHGWDHNGLAQSKAVIAARELGFDLVEQQLNGLGTAKAPTLKRLLAALPHDRNYVVGVKRHWLAIVSGVIVDNVTNSGSGRKVLELYEVRRAQAVA